MGQSLSQLYTHIVFSTKNRTRFLRNKKLRESTHAYLAGICQHLDSPAVIIGGIEDHVHLLVRLSKNVAVATFVREVKRDSSKWLKEQRDDLGKFAWQQGYGAFSISPSHVEALIQYIAGQEEHHRQETFQAEFLRVLKKYKIQIPRAVCLGLRLYAEGVTQLSPTSRRAPSVKKRPPRSHQP